MIPTKEELESLIQQQMSQRQIMKIYGVSQSAVSQWYSKYGLKSEIKTGGAYNIKNLEKQHFGDLTVLNYAYTNTYGKHYLCQCTCGKTKIYRGSLLTSGIVIGCGCKVGKSNLGKEYPNKSKSHIGEKYGQMTIIDVQKVHNQYEMVCECDCGRIKTVKYFDLIHGKTISCGCLQKEIISKIGSEIGLNNYKSNYDWYFIQNNKIIKCRSGYEVIYANYLISKKISFLYEPECFHLGHGKRYTPDFFIIDTNEYIEIKGSTKINNSHQLGNIELFKKEHNHKILFWKDIVYQCNLPLKTYNAYLKRADRLEIKREDYLARMLYL